LTASEIGAELSRARAANGLSLDELSQRTKIKTHVLELIEQGEFAQLPSLVFARNFVRQYASNVALDPEPLLASLPQLDDSMRQLPVPPLHPRKRQRAWRSSWQGIPDSNSHMGLMLAIPILLVGIGIGAWFHFKPAWPEFHWPRVSAASLPHATAPEPPRTEAAPQPVRQTPQKAAPEVSDQHPADPEPAASVQTPVGPAAAPVQVAVRAIESAWVQLVVDGQTAFAGTLQANETREVKGAEKVKIVAGKQGGLEVSLNGKRLGPMEPSDQIRVVTLTAAGSEPHLPARKPSGVSDQL
jgi:cytoskeletal protein RodZ